MNSLDQEKIDAAMGVISNAMDLIPESDEPRVQMWRGAARAWLDSYGRPVSPWPSGGPHVHPVLREERGDSRWKTIDPTGNVGEPSTLPEPDYDEGETGPPEVQA